jgi:hypothetical protein
MMGFEIVRSGPARSGRRSILYTSLLIRALAAAILGGVTAAADEPPPYRIEDGKVDRSTFLGWRVFHSTCYACHGVDATGTSVAPDLVERVEHLDARAFTIKVLTRYRIVVAGPEAEAEGGAGLRGAIIDEVMRRERGELIMPAWEADPNVKPHVLDLYAYLRARADGALGPGRPEQLSP